MLEVTQEDAPNKTLEILIDGQITLESMTRLKKTIEYKAKEWGQLNILERYVTMDRIDPRAIWEDLRLYAQNRKSINKVAIVSDKNWVKNVGRLISPFVRVDVQTFSNADIQTARRWLAA